MIGVNALSSWKHYLTLAALWLFAASASAAVYTLPGSLPAGCSAASSTSYSCANLSLGWNDSIVVVNANTTLTITGTFTANGNDFNMSAPAAGFAIDARTVGGGNYLNLNGNLSAINALSLGSNSNSISGNISAGGNTVVGGVINGTLTTSGDLTTGSATRITGNVSARSIVSGGGSTYGASLTATTGDITSGSADTIIGNVTASQGSVTLRSSSTSVGGSVVASGNVSLASGTTVGGDVTSAHGGVTLNSSNAKVGGSVRAKRNVDLESGTSVGGDVTSSQGNVTLKSSNASVDQCVTVDSSKRISLEWSDRVGKVCCNSVGTCGTSCVRLLDPSQPMPPLCVVAPVSTCITDTFSSGTLNTALWNVAGVGYTPQVVTSPTVPSGRLRLTDNAGNRSTFAQLRKWFPGANNRVVVEFDHYAWGGNGGDGIAMVLSDASIAPSPGGYGGSLGYANRAGINGFSGGWLGIGIGEFGNYPNSTESRRGYPAGYSPPAGANVAAGAYANSVAVRGSGVAQSSGYALLANSGTLSPVLKTTNALPNRYRLIVDHSNGVNAYVSLERNSGSGFVFVIPAFDVRAANSGQAAVPANLLLSFTGSTGGNTNYHEIANVSVCATSMIDPGGSTAAANFECLETGVLPTWSASERHPLYTKLAGTNFTLDIAALKTDGTLEANYVAAGGNSKYVKVELFDDTTPPASCAAYASPLAWQTVAFASGSFSTAAGRTLSGNFNLANASKKLICRVKECTDSSCSTYTAVAPACSSDRFAVRPSAATLVTTPVMAAGPSASAANPVKAGTAFKLGATTSASASASAGYAGALALDSGKLTAQITTQDASVQSGGVVGALTPGTLTANASAVDATYSEVGYLYLAAGAFRDESFTVVDSATGDCITSTTSDNNLADTLVGGKYGCHIGNKTAVAFGRFIPDHFVVTPGSVINRVLANCPVASTFTYAGEALQAKDFKITAYNGLATPTVTGNYSGLFARFDGAVIGNFGFGAVDLADSSAPMTASAFGNSASPGDIGLVSSSGSWGVGTGVGTFSANLKLNRSAAPGGPFESFRLGVAPVDLDLVTIRAGDKNLDLNAPADGVFDKVLIGSSKVRFGR